MTTTIINFEVDVVDAGDGRHFVRTSIDGRSIPELGPVYSRELAIELQHQVAKATRAMIETFLERQQWPVKVQA